MAGGRTDFPLIEHGEGALDEGVRQGRLNKTALREDENVD